MSGKLRQPTVREEIAELRADIMHLRDVIFAAITLFDPTLVPKLHHLLVEAASEQESNALAGFQLEVLTSSKEVLESQLADLDNQLDALVNKSRTPDDETIAKIETIQQMRKIIENQLIGDRREFID